MSHSEGQITEAGSARVSRKHAQVWQACSSSHDNISKEQNFTTQKALLATSAAGLWHNTQPGNGSVESCMAKVDSHSAGGTPPARPTSYDEYLIVVLCANIGQCPC